MPAILTKDLPPHLQFLREFPFSHPEEVSVPRPRIDLPLPYCGVHTMAGTVNVGNPHPAEIDAEALAAGLAGEMRWANQGVAPRQVSVATHSVVVCRVLRSYAGDGPALVGLLHDGSEYLLRDLPSPVKRLLPDYRGLEKRLQSAIYDRFGVTPDLVARTERELELIDAAAAVAEAQFLFKLDYFDALVRADHPHRLAPRSGDNLDPVWRAVARCAGQLDLLHGRDPKDLFLRELHRCLFNVQLARDARG
jgi:5'-deoxynucleotidase YfbR-like HD superfamily hydrolase